MVPDPTLWGFSFSRCSPCNNRFLTRKFGTKMGPGFGTATKEEPPRPYRALRGHSREQGGWEGAAGPIWGGRDPQGPKAELRGEKREKWAKRTENGECPIVGFRGLFVPSLILIFRTFLGFRIFDAGLPTPSAVSLPFPPFFYLFYLFCLFHLF